MEKESKRIKLNQKESDQTSHPEVHKDVLDLGAYAIKIRGDVYEALHSPEQKTNKMLELEQAQGDQPIEHVLYTEYMLKGRSQKSIGESITVSKDTIKGWNKAVGLSPQTIKKGVRIAEIDFIRRQGWSDPQIRQKREDSMRKTWKDPEKRKKRLAQIHSPSAEKQRSTSMKSIWANNPEIRSKLGLANHEQAMNNIKEVFSDNPKETLETLYRHDNLSPRQIAERYAACNLKVSQIYSWLRVLGIKRKSMSEARKGIQTKARIREPNKNFVELIRKTELFQALTEREQNILIERNKHGKSLKFLAGEYKITKERVRQIEKKALEKLRNPERKVNQVLTREKKQKAVFGEDPASLLRTLREVEGLSDRKIAFTYKISADQVRRWRLELGVTGEIGSRSSTPEKSLLERLPISERTRRALDRNYKGELSLDTLDQLANEPEESNTLLYSVRSFGSVALHDLQEAIRVYKETNASK